MFSRTNRRILLLLKNACITVSFSSSKYHMFSSLKNSVTSSLFLTISSYNGVLNSHLGLDKTSSPISMFLKGGLNMKGWKERERLAAEIITALTEGSWYQDPSCAYLSFYVQLHGRYVYLVSYKTAQCCYTLPNDPDNLVAGNETV